MKLFAMCHVIVPCGFGASWTTGLSTLGRTYGLPQGPSARRGELLDGLRCPTRCVPGWSMVTRTI
jgi:hypothetical protein